jgi:single-strand DNA-binding protein
MSGVNKQIVVGNVGKSETKTTQAGETILSFSVAANEVWYDSNTKEKRERVEWINCVMFGKRAASVAQYVTKGKQVYVEGRQQTRKWEKDGNTHYRTECIVNDLQLLGGGNGKGRHEADASQGSDNTGTDFGGDSNEYGDDSSIPF